MVIKTFGDPSHLLIANLLVTFQFAQQPYSVQTPFKEFMISSVLLSYNVLERPDFTNFRGDIWMALSKKDIVEKTIQY